MLTKRCAFATGIPVDGLKRKHMLLLEAVCFDLDSHHLLRRMPRHASASGHATLGLSRSQALVWHHSGWKCPCLTGLLSLDDPQDAVVEMLIEVLSISESD